MQVSAVFGEVGYANTASWTELLQTQHHRLIDLDKTTAGHCGCIVLVVNVINQDAELIATEARDKVTISKYQLQTFGNDFE